MQQGIIWFRLINKNQLKGQIKVWDLNKKENLIVSVIADDKISKLNKM